MIMKTSGLPALLLECAMMGFIVAAVLGLSVLGLFRPFRQWMDCDPEGSSVVPCRT